MAVVSGGWRGVRHEEDPILHPPHAHEHHQRRQSMLAVPVCALGGAVVEIFLDTAPHMRGTVTPPLRGGRHLESEL